MFYEGTRKRMAFLDFQGHVGGGGQHQHSGALRPAKWFRCYLAVLWAGRVMIRCVPYGEGCVLGVGGGGRAVRRPLPWFREELAKA